MSRWMERIRLSGARGIAAIIVLSLALAGCGGGDGDGDDPAATSEVVDAQPTVASDVTPGSETDEGSSGTPGNIDLSPAGSVETPAQDDDAAGGTPALDEKATPADDDAVTAGDDMVESASPDASPISAAVTDDQNPETPEDVAAELATPESDTSVVQNTGDVANLGDGTTGATPASAAVDQITDVLAETVLVTPGSGTPVVADEPVVAESCTPGAVPPFTGDQTTFVLGADLNFRAGPGSDCDLIGTGPLGEFSQVEVVSGPVIREGEEGIEWVQIQVGDDIGWVASEFLEPAE